MMSLSMGVLVAFAMPGVSPQSSADANIAHTDLSELTPVVTLSRSDAGTVDAALRAGRDIPEAYSPSDVRLVAPVTDSEFVDFQNKATDVYDVDLSSLATTDQSRLSEGFQAAMSTDGSTGD